MLAHLVIKMYRMYAERSQTSGTAGLLLSRTPLEPFSKYSVTVLLATVITFTSPWYRNSVLLLYCGYYRYLLDGEKIPSNHCISKNIGWLFSYRTAGLFNTKIPIEAIRIYNSTYWRSEIPDSMSGGNNFPIPAWYQSCKNDWCVVQQCVWLYVDSVIRNNILYTIYCNVLLLIYCICASMSADTKYHG